MNQQDQSQNKPSNEPHSTAYFAGGCFWGVEHLMQQNEGVISAISGYMGGHIENPSYEQVKAKTTGHAEVVQVNYQASKCSYETLVKLFFEIHDPCQSDGQGPDIGPQYRSEIFYTNEEQRLTAIKIMDILRAQGYQLATQLSPAEIFYPAEDYHQDYCAIKGIEPECHIRVKRFD